MTDPMDGPEAAEWDLKVPFVVCESQGGPYADDAFVAGFQAGQLSQALASAATAGAERLRATVYTTLVKQLDLIAMDRGFTLTATEVEETDEYPAMPEWSFAVFERVE